jgi:hypothetical protein
MRDERLSLGVDVVSVAGAEIHLAEFDKLAVSTLVGTP